MSNFTALVFNGGITPVAAGNTLFLGNGDSFVGAGTTARPDSLPSDSNGRVLAIVGAGTTADGCGTLNLVNTRSTANSGDFSGRVNMFNTANSATQVSGVFDFQLTGSGSAGVNFGSTFTLQTKRDASTSLCRLAYDHAGNFGINVTGITSTTGPTAPLHVKARPTDSKCYINLDNTSTPTAPSVSSTTVQMWFTTTGIMKFSYADGAVSTLFAYDFANGWLVMDAAKGIKLDGSNFMIGEYGDGSDGALSYSTDQTLSRDMFATNLTLSSSCNVNLNGFRMYVQDTTTIGSGCTITAKGSNASGTTGGAGSPSGTVGAGADGGNANTAGSNSTDSLGGAGGNGGGASNGGTVTAPAASLGSMRSVPQCTTGFLIGGGSSAAVQGGAGGGGGSGAGEGAGGGGGGVLILCSRRIVLPSGTGVINANGGTGSNGTNQGGGGGGGGLVLITTASSVVGTGTITASGGTGGTGGTNAGASGSAGTVLTVYN